MRWLANPATYAWGAAILTMLSAGTALLAPLLLDPAAFGSFALLTTLYQMAGKSDLGLSQLADRELTTGTANLERRGAEILQARWMAAKELCFAAAAGPTHRGMAKSLCCHTLVPSSVHSRAMP
jgi:hypothetical protein